MIYGIIAVLTPFIVSAIGNIFQKNNFIKRKNEIINLTESEYKKYKIIYNIYMIFFFIILIGFPLLFISFIGDIQELLYSNNSVLFFEGIGPILPQVIVIMGAFINSILISMIVWDILVIKYPGLEGVEKYKAKVMDVDYSSYVFNGNVFKRIKINFVLIIFILLFTLFTLKDYNLFDDKGLKSSSYFNFNEIKWTEMKSFDIYMKAIYVKSDSEWRVDTGFKINGANNEIMLYNIADSMKYESINGYINLIEIFNKKNIKVNVKIGNNVKKALEYKSNKNTISKDLYHYIK